ncbi:MAG: helix-turn-helix domain-containing protein [Clostridia bacterium]|nr:helix-turn-helix domain-containing protein [Clostridia bacterium]
MNSSEIFDNVILFLEKAIASGDEIDYSEISRIAMSPAALFQRIFIFVSGISISDYVRKRKLTLAARELINSDISVIDVAVKYGFNSHSSFTRAFKEHHGITPSEVTQGTVKLNDYFPINFSEMRFIGGKRIMAEMKKIIYKEAPERLMLGLHRETDFANGGQFWRDYFNSDAPKKLQALVDFKCCDDIDANDGIGIMYDFKGMENFNAIIGDFMKPDTEIPEGLCAKHIPAGLTAQVQIEGNGIPDILASAYMLIAEAIEKTGKKIDFDNFYWCEVYTHERFSGPQRRGEKVAIDYIIPIKSEKI